MVGRSLTQSFVISPGAILKSKLRQKEQREKSWKNNKQDGLSSEREQNFSFFWKILTIQWNGTWVMTDAAIKLMETRSACGVEKRNCFQMDSIWWDFCKSPGKYLLLTKTSNKSNKDGYIYLYGSMAHPSTINFHRVKLLCSGILAYVWTGQKS